MKEQMIEALKAFIKDKDPEAVHEAAMTTISNMIETIHPDAVFVIALATPEGATSLVSNTSADGIVAICAQTQLRVITDKGEEQEEASVDEIAQVFMNLGRKPS